MDLSISKFMELAPPDAVSTELRDHCLDLYQRVVISHLKASIKAEDLSKKKINELTDQHASLANEHKREKDRADHLTDDYAKFRQEHFTTVAQLSEQTQKLEAQTANLPNYEYIKNVMIQYFSTNDTAIHINLLRVIFVALQFTEEEQKKVKDAFNELNMSYMSRMTGAKLI